MKKVLLLVGLVLAGCNAGTTHMVRNNVEFQAIDVESTSKKSEGCDLYIPIMLMAGPLGWDDTSIMTIAKKGKIDTITWVDKNWHYILPFYAMECYTVYGY